MANSDVLPEGWVDAALSDLFIFPTSNIVDGPFGSNLKSSEYVSSGIPVLRIQNIDRNCFIAKNIVYITEEKANELERHSFVAGDIVLTKLGDPLGKACIIPDAFKNGIIVADLVRLRLEHDFVNKTWLTYAINVPFIASQLKDKTKGTTRPRVNLEHVRALRIQLPPLNEQSRIVAKIEELFSKLDAGVESLKKAKEQLAIYRQSLLKQAFEGKLTTDWRKENTHALESSDAIHKRVKQEREKHYKKQLEQWARENKQWETGGKKGEKPIKPQAQKILPPLSKEESENLPTLPTGWAWVRLGELIETPAYGTSKKSDYGIDGTGVLRIPNIVNGKIDNRDLKFTQFDPGEKDKYSLKPGDLLTIRSNGSISLVGQCALISERDTQYAYAGYLIRLRPLSMLDSKYLLHCFSSLMTRNQIEDKAKSTSGVNNINSQELAALIIPICSLQEQKIISHEVSLALSASEKQESALAQSLSHADFLRASILSKAFSGTLVPQRQGDEPASKLLDKIKRERSTTPKPKRESRVKAKS